MPLFVHRARRVERLVTLLARHLAASLPADPFAAAAVVVGSRGMERWLRHELATQLGVAARIEFPFPRHALDGAARILGRGATVRTALGGLARAAGAGAAAAALDRQFFQPRGRLLRRGARGEREQ